MTDITRNNDISPEDLKLFLQEAEEQLQLLDEDIVKLEKESANVNLLQEIFRAAHTIKGSSAMIGHQRMSEVAHAMEDVFDRVRKGTLQVDAAITDALLSGLDMLKILKKELTAPGESLADITRVTAGLKAVISGTNTAAAVKSSVGTNQTITLTSEAKARIEQLSGGGQRVYQAKIIVKKDTEWAAIRCYQVLNDLSAKGEVIVSIPTLKEIEDGKTASEISLVVATQGEENTIRDVIKLIPDIESSEITIYPKEDTVSVAENKIPSAEVSAHKEDAGVNQTVRVNVTRLDTLMEEMGELVINRNSISQITKMLGEKYQDDELVQSLSNSLSQIGTNISTLQEDIMTIRMLPIEIVFNSLPRMVRDLARKLGKNVNFVIEGQETEVDRSVIEYLRDPLVHLLRNAVDHGVETPEERQAAGKPVAATVRLRAFQEQDNITITINDDGKGIDVSNVREAAVRKQLMTPEQAESLTDSDAMDLIFASGLSTAKRTSEVSGRGVGLDIVKTNVQAMGGSIKVESQVGKGTMFSLVLPLTLAIIPTLLVKTGSTTCALPLSNIVEVATLHLDEIQTIQGREVTIFRNKVMPLLRLNHVFHWENPDIQGKDNLDNFVIIKHHDNQMGILVDSLIGQQEIVVKALNHLVGSDAGITGASVLGDGQVILILDVGSLFKELVADQRRYDVKKSKVLVQT